MSKKRATRRDHELMKEIIKDYWETRLPQTWYSNKRTGSIEWFNEIAYQRYNVYYDFIPKIAEFEYHTGEKVLEIGVGIGTDLVQFAKHGAKVHGIDLTVEAIKMTEMHLATYGLRAECLGTADGEKLPFEDNTFDLVYSFGVLHHTPNTRKAIEEIYRVLKHEGKCIVMLYARGWKHYVKRVFLQGIVKGKIFRHGYKKAISKTTEVHGDSPLTYVLGKRQIRKLFECFSGCSIVRYRLGEFFDYAPYKTKKLPDVVRRMLYFVGAEKLLGENFVITAFKRQPVRERYKVSVWDVLWNSYGISKKIKESDKKQEVCNVPKFCGISREEEKF